MLPLYLVGNLHCMGMCGPLVLMLGKHRYRSFYFLGRLLSFTLAGVIAGELGAVSQAVLQAWHFPAAASFFLGGGMIMMGICHIARRGYPGYQWLSQRLAKVNRTLSLLLLRDNPWATFLFGFFTVTLPCGQTVLVYSACALSGDVVVGMINGFAFALLTSPSLYLAMHAHVMLHWMKSCHHLVIGGCGMIVGGLALCRGFADMGLIPHYVFDLHAPIEYHIALF